MSRNDIDGLRVERNRCLAELAESQEMNARLARELAAASREIDRLEDELELLRDAAYPMRGVTLCTACHDQRLERDAEAMSEPRRSQ